MSAVDKLWKGVREAIQLNAKVDQLFSAVGQHQRRLEDLTERLTRLEARFDTTLQIAGMLKPPQGE